MKKYYIKILKAKSNLFWYYPYSGLIYEVEEDKDPSFWRITLTKNNPKAKFYILKTHAKIICEKTGKHFECLQEKQLLKLLKGTAVIYKELYNTSDKYIQTIKDIISKGNKSDMNSIYKSLIKNIKEN
jgi:hypothetical protein